MLFHYKKCTACHSCFEVCPRKAITIYENKEGFLYPKADPQLCTNCGLCQKACPITNKSVFSDTLNNCYAAQYKNEAIRLKSSSGGIFTVLSEKILEKKGIVFGAEFNANWEVIHNRISNSIALKGLRGSKYIQSNINNSFGNIKKDIRKNKLVLFSGTPCQVAGLKTFLGRDYSNLICIDFICHGVPSLKVWKKYLKETIDKKNIPFDQIVDISFRNKSTGWRNYNFSITYSNNNFEEITVLEVTNLYMKGFIEGLYLRPSCYNCQFKNFNSGADITIADAWGIENFNNVFIDNKGTSLVIPSTLKGENIWNEIKEELNYSIVDPKIIKKHNPAAYYSPQKHKNRKKFFKLLNKKQIGFEEIITQCLPPPTFFERIEWSINQRIKKYFRNET